MKVHNTTIFMGDITGEERRGNTGSGKTGSSKNIFAGNLNNNIDPIAQKKKEARKQAMKIITDTWDGDRQIDNDIKERQNRIDKLRGELHQLRKDSEGVEDDYYKEQIANIEKEIETENAIIRGTKLERLKKDPMVAAKNQADEVMDAASKEIVGMLMDEAKDHIDEEMEKKLEEAKKKAEEKKEQEEKLEKTKEKKEQQEELTEKIIESTEQMAEISSAQEDVLQEVKDLVNKMNLLGEDIKGAAVDETL